MKKFLRFLLIIVLCVINIKIGKCATSIGTIEIYDSNHNTVVNLQRGKQYNLGLIFNYLPQIQFEDDFMCAVLNINFSNDITINNKTQESIQLGCDQNITPNITVPIDVLSSPDMDEKNVYIDYNVLVYGIKHPENRQEIQGERITKKIFSPKLSVDVQTDKEYYKQNDTIEFTINVTNNGPSFEDAIVEFQTNKLGDIQILGDIKELNIERFNLKSMSSGESKTIKIKAIVKGDTNFDLFIIPYSLDFQYFGDVLFQKRYDVYKPNVVTTNTFNLEDIRDDEEYSFKITFTNDSVVSSGKFTSSFALDKRLQLLSAESATIDGNKLTWNIDNIGAGEFVEYTIKVKKIKEIDDEVVIEPDIDYEEDKDEPQPSEDENKDDENQNNNNINKPSNEYADKEAENPKTADQNYMIIGIVGVLLIILATIYFKVKNKKHIFKV